ncbi:MAG: ComEC/Rec2 family competence protein [Ginsengibacter sp.]
MSKSYHIFIWKKAPFLRLLIPLLAGIITEFYLQIHASQLLVIAVVIFCFLVVFSFLPTSFQFRFKPLQGLLLSLLLLLLGSFLTWNKDVRNHSHWFGHFTNPRSLIVATISEPPQEKAKSFKAVAIVNKVLKNDSLHRTQGKILLYFQKSERSQNLKYGDRVVVNKVLSPIFNSGNPAAFDYQQYCAFRQIYRQAYVKENQWQKLAGKNENVTRKILFSIREKIVSVLQNYLGNDDESSIAKALLIGYKIDLDKDLVQAYSNAGVVHIIAISGLHIGIIYAILLWIFLKLPITKKSKLLRLIFILSGLWFFVFITGASPSASRAGIMFSFILIGSAFDKSGSVYNSIAASAFLLLCFDPNLLWNVGFQLSYLAVIGIVTSFKHISNWFFFKNKWIEKAWQLCAVSLSAQLFTFPLALYYFHQFPFLFLLSNIIAIPLASVALIGCLILIIVSAFPLVAIYFSKLVFAVIWSLNHYILWVDSIPYSRWSGISISTLETFLLYGLIIFFLIAFIKKNKRSFAFALAFSLALVVSKSLDKWQQFQQKKIIVYNIPKHKAVEFIGGKKFLLETDNKFNQDILYDYDIKPAHIAFAVNEKSNNLSHLFAKNHFYQFYNSKFLMIDSSFHKIVAPQKIKLNYILISQNPIINLADLVKTFDCDNFIFDASNFPWNIQRWKKECEDLHLHFHSVQENGAFVINL